MPTAELVAPRSCLADRSPPHPPSPELARLRERAAALLAMAPDADVLAFGLGIPYEHPLGHRGLSHSLLGALVLGALAFALLRHLLRAAEDPAARPGWLDLALLVVATASHGLLDMLTDGGRGVGLFIPVDTARLFFPVTPIPVSPIGLLAFFAWGLPVLAWEVALLWPIGAAGAALGATGLPVRVRVGVAAGLLAIGAGAWAIRLAP